MLKRPIVGIAICMTVGIFVGYATGVPLKIAYIGLFVFAITSVVAWILEKRAEKGITFIFICLGVFFLGIMLLQGERQNLLAQARALGIELPGGQGKIEAKKGQSEAKKENSGSEWRSSERSKRFQYVSIRGIICTFSEERNVYLAERGGEEEDEIEAASEENAISDKTPEASARISSGMKKISFPLEIEEVKRKDKWEKMDGKIQVNVYESEEIASPFDSSTEISEVKLKASNDNEFGDGHAKRKFRIGDRVEINGHLQPLPSSRNPGDFDYGVYLMRQGIVGQMSPVRDKTPKVSALPSAGISNGVSILSRNNINFITWIAARGRDWMEKIIDLGPYEGGRDALLKAMLIGKRENMDEGTKQNFINTGTIHIIAISGLHFIIIMAIILFICKIFYLPERLSSILCIVFLIIYAFLAGGRPSVWRATIMAGLFLGSKLFLRQADNWTTLSLAGIILLFISPQQLFDSGFQLTFMAVAGLMYLYPRLECILKKRFGILFKKHVTRYFTKALLTIASAQIALGPFLLYYYYRFPFSAFVANLIIVPLLGIVTVLGFVSASTGLFSLSLAMAFNATNDVFLIVMEKTASFLSNIKGQIIYLPKLEPVLFLFYYLILFLLFFKINLKEGI